MMALLQNEQNAKQEAFEHQDCKYVCFGKTADVLQQVDTRLLSSRMMCITDGRHKIRYSFIVQLTNVVCNSEWYRYVPYEFNFL